MVGGGDAPKLGIRMKTSQLNEWYTFLNGASLSEIWVFVQWYNLRRYASRTYISKIANLSNLRNAFERKCHTLSGVRHRAKDESRDEIEKSRIGNAGQPHA